MAKNTGKAKVKMEHGHPAVWESDKALKKYYKALDIEEIVEWSTALGETFKATDDPMIFRMRACMSVLYHFFPKQTKPKQKSKYADYTLEDLVSLAATNNVPVEPCEDERILRMRCIMMLRAHKVIE